jgi:hypothetical protein
LPSEPVTIAASPWARTAGGSMLIVLLLLMLALGVYPSPFVRLALGAVIDAPPLLEPITQAPQSRQGG